VPTEIVTELAGVNVYPMARLPVKGLLSASKPTANGGDILIDTTLPLAEQRVTLMHELKHIVDGGHAIQLRTLRLCASGEQLCTEFALSVLMPVAWLRADWNDGKRSSGTLAERYQVPIRAIEQRLYALGLINQRPQQRDWMTCQWHTESTTNLEDKWKSVNGVAKGMT
jgi:Zn-dependent peptidase ImmA (M78 family)